jgi:hypothetical protein
VVIATTVAMPRRPLAAPFSGRAAKPVRPSEMTGRPK